MNCKINKSMRLNIQMIAPICPYRRFGGGIVSVVSSLINQLSNKFDFRIVGIKFESVKKNSSAMLMLALQRW